MSGQKSQRRLLESRNRAVLQSGNPGVSASKKASPHRPAPAFLRAPWIATSSAERSPLPRYHDTRRSPLGHSTIPGAWLCLGWSGKTSSASCRGPFVRAFAGLFAGFGRAFRPVRACLSFSCSALLSGRALPRKPGRSLSQTRFSCPCMSLVSAVIATTTSCSGSTMQNWPFAPSPRYAPCRHRQNWNP